MKNAPRTFYLHLSFIASSISNERAQNKEMARSKILTITHGKT
jgi:hypothetical protein